LRVRKQLERWKRNEMSRRVEPKTPQAIRDVVLTPALAAILRDHKERAFALGVSRPNTSCFAPRRAGRSTSGTSPAAARARRR
jgi:hypothetical protein